jgi:hypothetical protein
MDETVTEVDAGAVTLGTSGTFTEEETDVAVPHVGDVVTLTE